MSKLLAGLGAVVFLLGSPEEAKSQFLQNDDFVFEAVNQNMWGGSGPGSISYDEFLGVSWNTSLSLGGIAGSSSTVIVPGGCLPFVGCWDAVTSDTRTGLQFTGTTDGRIGLNVGAAINSGRIDVTMPGQASLMTSGEGGVSGEVYSIATSYAVDPTASMSTQFPSLELYADFVFDVNATGTGTACLIGSGCTTSTGTFIDVNATLELASVNRNGSGAINVLGVDLTEFPGVDPLSTSVGPVDLTVNFPNLETEAAAPSTTLSSSGDVNVLEIGVDVPNLVANSILPGSGYLLSGSLLGLEYNVLGSSLGPRFGIGQQFDFVSTPMTTLAFSTPVSPIVGGVTMAPTTSFDAPLGSTVDFIFPQAMTVDVTPTYWLDNTINVDTDFLSRLGLDVDILSLTTPLGSLGPVYSNTFQTSAVSIGLDDRDFALAFNSFQGSTFSIVNVPEPSILLLLATGLLGLAVLGRKRRLIGNRLV